MFNQTKPFILNAIVVVLILLWAYTAASKLIDIAEFKRQLYNQSFSLAFANVLLWAVPTIELFAAVLLVVKRTQLYGLLLSFLLMLLFTGYVALVLLGFYDRVPCSCGGVLKQLGWQAHLWFNLFFLGISSYAIYLIRPLGTFSFRRRKRQNR